MREETAGEKIRGKLTSPKVVLTRILDGKLPKTDQIMMALEAIDEIVQITKGMDKDIKG